MLFLHLSIPLPRVVSPGRRSIEHFRLVAIQQDAFVDVPVHCTGLHYLFQVRSNLYQIFPLASMGDTHHILFDDGASVPEGGTRQGAVVGLRQRNTPDPACNCCGFREH